MKGSFSFPLTYGYSVIGEVVEGPSHLLGSWVHLMHPHGAYCKVLEKDVFLLPEEGNDRYVLVANMETAINAIWDSGVSLGDQVLVIGQGSVGFLVALLVSKITGVDVCVEDSNPVRQKLGEDSGFLKHAEGNCYDMVFHTSGSQEGLQNAIDWLKTEGKVIELSWYGTRHVQLQLGGEFHSRRKRIISSQVSRIPVKKSEAFDFQKRKALAVRLIQQENLPELKLFSLAEIVDAFNKGLSLDYAFCAIDYSLK